MTYSCLTWLNPLLDTTRARRGDGYEMAEIVHRQDGSCGRRQKISPKRYNYQIVNNVGHRRRKMAADIKFTEWRLLAICY